MLRSLIAGVLTLSAIPACGKSSEAPAVVAGATAGKVIAAEGEVTATRGGATRTLSAGDAISGDDLITTAAGASVRIWLSHNNATWSLEENRSGKVGESAAWTLARVDEVPEGVDEVTTAAGRHAERSAAESSTTARSQTAAPQPSPDPAAVAAPAEPSGSPLPAPPPPPPPPRATVPIEREEAKADAKPAKAAKRDVAPRPESAMAAPSPEVVTRGRGPANADEVAKDAPVIGAAGGGGDDEETTDVRRKAPRMERLTEIDQITSSISLRLRRCLTQAEATVTIAIVDKTVVVRSKTASAKELACMNDIAKTQKGAGANATKTLTLTKP